MRILVIEDDPKIARFVHKGLEAEGHRVEAAHDGETGVALATSAGFDLVLLDLMLPKIDGFEVLRRLRLVDQRTLVIVLTARSEVEDRVKGLEMGADDYLPKPFSFVELRARIRSLFRRVDRATPPTLQVGELTLDRVGRSVSRLGREEKLTTREFLLLDYLMRSPEEPLTRAMIADRVWGYQFDTGTNVIDVYMNYLRNKLRRLGVQPIATIRGIGYVFDPQVCAAPAP